ncbi:MULTISPECIES: hypothetical protein [unclassified Cryobacterium]|uniref:aggregation-promoting factor C-terminal-like domain-containing protein n=1 Tax=unclassified Cryobacterium TaxID=2649013 RepID=UPI00157FA6B1|nr:MULTISPECIES: hypothetical protein [unclassified Cryobacterium]
MPETPEEIRIRFAAQNKRSNSIPSSNGTTGPGTIKRPHRIAIIATSVLAITGLAVGAGFAGQSASATQDRVSATTALADSTGLHREQLGAYSAVAKAHVDNSASITLNEANQVIAATQDKVDASSLAAVASSLASYEILPLDEITSLTAQTKAETAAVTAASIEADRVAAEAAAAAAAQAAAEAEAQAAAESTRAQSVAGGNTPAAARATAQAMAASQYGWGEDQFSCLNQLWQKESEWKYDAVNSNGGATGIPQALPGNKMATAGSDWATNATTQIAWGLGYIKASSYGTPCAAWSHSQANNWY